MDKRCCEFSFFGATYPDARCVGGHLYDMDDCDKNGNLLERDNNIPCPFCDTDEFIEYDPFCLVDYFCGDMEEDGDEITESMERLAKSLAKEYYVNWINKIKERYG